ncbi:MAG: response regulator transcription factor [Rhodospirillaceae bacterium]|nr:response regulator transcription factor [Rhodospirillaceae bacterium]MCA8932591.1 response regulator transcription factor [Rhodospirillaceae bacterium]
MAAAGGPTTTDDPFTVRVVIADDHAIVRAGLKGALETPGLVGRAPIKVVEEVADGLAAIAAVEKHRPDLLLLDVAMPHAGGVEVLLEIKRWSPKTKVVVLTGMSAAGLIGDLIDAGVDGLCSKSADISELFQKLPLIISGGRYISPVFVDRLHDQPARTELTDRERQTLNMIIAGRSTKEIARALSISPKTVDKYRTSLMQKLQVNSVPQLLARAIKEGLIDPAREL